MGIAPPHPLLGAIPYPAIGRRAAGLPVTSWRIALQSADPVDWGYHDCPTVFALPPGEIFPKIAG